MPKFENVFQKVYCVNLDRRTDRWQEFCNNLPKDWPFAIPERWQAIDGKLCKSPPWWFQGNPAWGCYKSHLNIVEHCLNNGINSVLILEDDALFCDNFSEIVEDYINNLPENWGQIYFGANHLQRGAGVPIKFNDYWYRPYNVNSTHCYALQMPFMQKMYIHLNRVQDWPRGNHVDHHYGVLHKKRVDPVYTSAECLVGQSTGKSDISGKTWEQKLWWKGAAELSIDDVPIVFVIGLHRCGSSALATSMQKLGVHFGHDTTGGECKLLANVCENAMRFPSWLLQQPENKIRKNLLDWIEQTRKEAKAKQTIAGAKYPHLARLLHCLKEQDWPLESKLIHINRPIEESVDSLMRRSVRLKGKWPSCTEQQACELSKMLEQNKLLLFEEMGKKFPILEIQYANLRENPEQEIRRVIEFCEITPSEKQIKNAITNIIPIANPY